ncbi:MAG: hypothetical protein VKP72_09975 [bacterium]|nr:hypothetical protein [bacterium]
MGDGNLARDPGLEARIALHDRQHFEIELNYEVSPHLAHPDGRVRTRVDAYFFLPTQMGITTIDYTRDEFFRDVFSYLRFKTPTISIRELADPIHTDSPLNRLAFRLVRMAERPERDSHHEGLAIQEAKLVGCIVIAHWRERRAALRQDRAVRRPFDAGAWRAEIEEDLRLLDRIRTLTRIHVPATMGDPKGLPRVLRRLDEILTYRFDEHLAKVHALMPPGDLDGREALEAYVLRVAEAEHVHRVASGYLVLDRGHAPSLERYTYRVSGLKKYLAQVLWLDVETIREADRWRGWFAAIGAALAAFWSTLGDRNVNVHLHGVSTAVLIGIIVAVYILKDRIKEMVRERLSSVLGAFLPARKLRIRDPLTGLRIGTCRQTFEFLDKSRLPEDIRRVRDFTHVQDLDEEKREAVLGYRHRISLDPRAIQEAPHPRRHVKHILRYSVAALQHRLSDPSVEVPCFDAEQGGFETLQGPKVYHLNVVLRVSSGRYGVPVYHRLRAILSKDGLVRVEAVVLNQPLQQVGGLTGPSQPVMEALETEDLAPG